MSKEDQRYLREITEYRRQVTQDRRTAAQDADRILITLGGGALILSVTFVTYLAPESDWRSLLVASWVSLLISMVLVSFSYLTSDRASDKRIRHIDDWMRDPNREVELPEPPQPRTTRTIMEAAHATLYVGLALLAVFAALNFQ